MKLLLSLSCLLAGCGGTLSVLQAHTDPELLPYVERYRDEVAPTSTLNVYSTLADLPYPTVGKCRTYTNGHLEIVIDRTHWNKGSGIAREVVMFHELTHCIAGLGHDNSTMELNGLIQPASIMNKYTVNELIYAKNRNMYIKDLRKKTSK